MHVFSVVFSFNQSRGFHPRVTGLVQGIIDFPVSSSVRSHVCTAPGILNLVLLHLFGVFLLRFLLEVAAEHCYYNREDEECNIDHANKEPVSPIEERDITVNIWYWAGEVTIGAGTRSDVLISVHVVVCEV